MPIKFNFVLKTIIRGSNNVTPTTKMLSDLTDLRANSLITPSAGENGFEILVKKERGVMTVDTIDITGKLTEVQTKLSSNLHTEATNLIKTGSGDDERIKIVFILKN